MLLVESPFNHREPKSLNDPFRRYTKQSLLALFAVLAAYSNWFASSPNLGQADSDPTEARATFLNVPIKAPLKTLGVVAPCSETNTEAVIKIVVIVAVLPLMMVDL